MSFFSYSWFIFLSLFQVTKFLSENSLWFARLIKGGDYPSKEVELKIFDLFSLVEQSLRGLLTI